MSKNRIFRMKYQKYISKYLEYNKLQVFESLLRFAFRYLFSCPGNIEAARG